MTYFLSFLYFALATHMIDAARHYMNEEETFSCVLNFSWGVTAILIGIGLLVYSP